MDARRLVAYAAAVVVGVPPAFFLVFAGVFTDPGAPWERAVSLGLVAAAYLLLGGVFGYALRDAGWRVGLAVGAASFLFLAWYVTREPQDAPLHLAYLVASVGVAVLAADLADRIRARRADGHTA